MRVYAPSGALSGGKRVITRKAPQPLPKMSAVTPTVMARRREIGIMRLVGASNRFIQTPFILEGVFAALIGSLLASAAVIAGVQFGVNDYLRRRVDFVTTWVSLADAWTVVPILILIGIVLAALSAGFAIRRWLRA